MNSSKFIEQLDDLFRRIDLIPIPQYGSFNRPVEDSDYVENSIRYMIIDILKMITIYCNNYLDLLENKTSRNDDDFNHKYYNSFKYERPRGHTDKFGYYSRNYKGEIKKNLTIKTCLISKELFDFFYIVMSWKITQKKYHRDKYELKIYICETLKKITNAINRPNIEKKIDNFINKFNDEWDEHIKNPQETKTPTEWDTISEPRSTRFRRRNYSPPEKRGTSFFMGGKIIKIKNMQLFGKEKCIYKKSGDRKEYIKYKGRLITVSDYKKNMKKV
jgi:hypothetical protein